MHYNIEVFSGNEFFWECLRTYWSTFSVGIKLLLLGYPVLLLLILIFGTKKERCFFAVQTAILILCPLNPPVAWQLVIHLDFATRYFRLFWMLPVVLSYAYVFLKVYDRLPKWLKTAAGVFAAVFFLWSCRQITVWSGSAFTGNRPNTGMMPFTSIFKVEDDVVQAADMIEADYGERYAVKRVLYDYNTYLEIRAYDGAIECFVKQQRFDRSREYSQEEYDALLTDHQWRELLHFAFFNLDGQRGIVDVRPKDLKKAMKKCRIDYVILPKNNTYYDTWLEAGEKIGETEFYTVLRSS